MTQILLAYSGKNTALTQLFEGFNSTRGALIMRMLLPRSPLQRVSLLRYVWLCLGVALFTYVPPIIAGIVLDHRLVGSGGELLLPYLHDVNMMTTLLVSLPALSVIYLRGARLLPDVMNRLTKDGTAVWQQKDADAFIVRWERYYERMNRWSVPIGIVVAAAAIIMNYGFSM